MQEQILREEMVKKQLIPRGISDSRVLNAFRKVPRHIFLPDALKAAAYDDRALSIGEGQTISQPYMVAVMTEELGLKGDEIVLEIGTGSGYQAAILAELCQKVFTIERIEVLSKQAEKNIKQAGYSNVSYIIGDGTLGYSEESPYDAIIVTAACPEIPKPLLEQLKEGGRIVLPVGDLYQQILMTAVKHGNEFKTKVSVPCMFVPLIGKFGFSRF